MFQRWLWLLLFIGGFTGLRESGAVGYGQCFYGSRCSAVSTPESLRFESVSFAQERQPALLSAKSIGPAPFSAGPIWK